MIACDLGSNTFRVVELDCRTGERIREYEKIVRLAEGISERGEISPEALQRLIASIGEADRIFRFGNKPVRCVATAAMRMAENGARVRERIRQETGLDFEIIDAGREAALTRLAVRHRLKKMGFSADSCALLDLGGGSTELTICEKGRYWDQSFEIGIVTILERYGPQELEEKIMELYRPLQSFFRESVARIGKRPERFVATAGTPTTIAAFLKGIDYAHYDYRLINGSVVTRAMLRKTLKRLLAMEREERIRWVGVGREDLIIAGVLMVERILALCGYDEMVVVDDGLREGVALEACGENLAK